MKHQTTRRVLLCEKGYYRKCPALPFVCLRLCSVNWYKIHTNAWVTASGEALCFKTSRSCLQGDEEWSGQCGTASNASNLLCGALLCYSAWLVQRIAREREQKKELSFCELFKASLAFKHKSVWFCCCCFFVCRCLIFFLSLYSNHNTLCIRMFMIMYVICSILTTCFLMVSQEFFKH